MLNTGQSTVLDYVTLGKLDNQQLTKMWVITYIDTFLFPYNLILTLRSVKQTMG